MAAASAPLEPGLHRGDVGGIERERYVGHLLHRLDQPRHDLDAELLLGADVEVDDAGAGLDLTPSEVLQELRVARPRWLLSPAAR